MGSVFLINVPIALLGVACAVPLIPDSKNPHALPPDVVGALMSIAGLGLVLWSLIEAPVRGWSSPLVIGAGIGGLAVLGACWAARMTGRRTSSSAWRDSAAWATRLLEITNG